MEKFPNTYKFCNNDIKKFILSLRKGFYPYEYIDSWERFDKTSFPNKEAFYSSLYMVTTSRLLSSWSKSIWIIYKKHFGEYHDLYVQSDTLLLADVFENLRNKCTEIYELDLAHFLSATGLRQE